MSTKTITVTEDAYEALRGMKEERESFSEAILRISNKNSIKEFIGILSDKSATRLEETIKEMRKRHTESHGKRVKGIVERLSGHGSS